MLWVNTPHGYGLVLFLMDYGPYENSVWVVANEEDGKIRHYNSNQITFAYNHTFDMNVKDFKNEANKKRISEDLNG